MIQAWGQQIPYDRLEPRFHIPNEDEVDFACEFVDVFLYQQIELLNENCSNMFNEERLRSLTLIHAIAIGCLRMAPRIPSDEVLDLYYFSLYMTNDSV